MNKKINKKGFTLIELIVVIAILAVLGLLLVPQISGYIDSSKKAVAEANARACYSAQMAYKTAQQAELGADAFAIPEEFKDGGKCKWDGAKETATWTEGTITAVYPTAAVIPAP